MISERADAEVVGILDTAEALGEGVGIVVTSDMGTTLKCVFLGWEQRLHPPFFCSDYLSHV